MSPGRAATTGRELPAWPLVRPSHGTGEFVSRVWLMEDVAEVFDILSG